MDDTTGDEAIEKLARFVMGNAYFLDNALRVYAARMTEEANQARLAFKQGQTFPEVRATQDASVMTNAGFRMAAEMFADAARKATEMADRLAELIEEVP